MCFKILNTNYITLHFNQTKNDTNSILFDQALARLAVVNLLSRKLRHTFESKLFAAEPWIWLQVPVQNTDPRRDTNGFPKSDVLQLSQRKQRSETCHL